MLKRSFLGFMLVAMLAAPPALAEDCGFPPQDRPVVPDGERATRAELTAAIEHLRDYGERVNNHLNCLQARRDTLFYNMNKEQQARWVEDFNALADDLTDIENSMNQEIRRFNQRDS